MAPIGGTFQTYDAKGLRESLADIIYNISPEDTPFVSNSKKGSVDQTLYEWQRDSLAAVDTANAVVAGEEAAFTLPAATVRMGNRTQISRKTVIISGTLEAVNKAGRASELAYQIAKRGAELKRDIEAISLSNQGSVAAAGGVAPKTGTLGATLGLTDGAAALNVSKGATGVNPVDATNTHAVARTDGTQRAITEALLQSVVQGCWTNGGMPDTLMVGPVNKKNVSAFAGIATKQYHQTTPTPSAIIGSADVYVSEFGVISVVPNRFQRERDAWLFDFEYSEIEYLRPFQLVDLAKTGDAEKKMEIVEWGIKIAHEQAHGLIADLLTT